VGALALAVVFVACGKSNPKKQPDAAAMPDAARVCTNVTPGMLDAFGYQPMGMPPNAFWGAPLTGTLADGNPLTYQFEIYGGIEPSLVGTFDLSMGNQANYMTCAVCVRAFDNDAMGNLVKQFYQLAGTVTLTEDPLAAGHLVGSVTGLELQEVNVDMTTFASTPVPNGACATLGSFSVDHDKVPNAWTCSHAAFQDGTTCDCKCGGTTFTGLYDPDCDLKNPPVNGCTTGQGCFKDGCVNRPANQTCQTATPVVVNATGITGTTIGANEKYNAGLEGAACVGAPVPGPDAVYSVVMTAATQYTVTLSGLDATYDGAIALVGPDAGTPGSVCDANPIATCVKGADAMAAGGNETFSFTPTTTGTYFVLVTSALPFQSGGLGDNAGTYTIAVTSP